MCTFSSTRNLKNNEVYKIQNKVTTETEIRICLKFLTVKIDLTSGLLSKDVKIRDKLGISVKCYKYAMHNYM